MDLDLLSYINRLTCYVSEQSHSIILKEDHRGFPTTLSKPSRTAVSCFLATTVLENTYIICFACKSETASFSKTYHTDMFLVWELYIPSFLTLAYDSSGERLFRWGLSTGSASSLTIFPLCCAIWNHRNLWWINCFTLFFFVLFMSLVLLVMQDCQQVS